VKNLPRDPFSEITSGAGNLFVTDLPACRNPDGFPTSRDEFTPSVREIQSTPGGNLLQGEQLTHSFKMPYEYSVELPGQFSVLWHRN
jgi:hypothetical protein